MSLFHDRTDASRRLAEALGGLNLHRPVVLGIPRGGLVTGAALASRLGAELDVALSRKLRAPFQPELALGAVGEDGAVYINPEFAGVDGRVRAAIEREIALQSDEIARRRVMYRAVRPAAELAGRDVIVTDDGIATGSTMIAALRTARAQRPRRLIAAAPVAPPERLDEVRPMCDEVVCLHAPEDFHAIGQFYDDFSQVDDEAAAAALREAWERLGPSREG